MKFRGWLVRISLTFSLIVIGVIGLMLTASQPVSNPILSLSPLPGQSIHGHVIHLIYSFSEVAYYELDGPGYLASENGITLSVYFSLDNVILADAEDLWGRPDRVERSSRLWIYYWDYQPVKIHASSSNKNSRWSILSDLESIVFTRRN